MKYLKRISCSFLAIALCMSIAAKDERGSIAKFDYFEYIGNDDFYRENPLPHDNSFYNPIVPGWHSDPSICRVGNDYFMVMSTFTYYPGVPLFHSRDLVNWRQIGNILDRPSQLPALQGQPINTGGIYAPAISYNPHNKTYYMITTDVGRGHFYVTTQDPFGKWSDPHWLPTIGGIDPSFFFDDDGKAYIVHKEDTEGKPKWSNFRSIRITRFDTTTGDVFGEDMPFRESGVGPEERLDRNEGPHIYKINGKYYMICAEGGTSWAHSEVVYRADSVLGPYTRWSRNPMLTQRLLKANRNNAVTCTGHVDIVDTPDGEWWGVFLGCRPDQNGFECLGRETFIMPIKWSADGFPYMTQSKDTIPLVLHRKGIKREKNVTFGNFTWRDDFTGKTLRPEWLSIWGSAEKYYKTGNGLRLSCAPITLKDRRTPAYIGRRLQHHKYTVTTCLIFKPEEGEAAGLLLVKNEEHQYFMALRKGYLALLQIGRGADKEIATQPIKTDGRPISLRIEARGTLCDFYYKEEGNGWQLLAKDIDATHISSRRGGGFTGSTVGMYAVKNQRE